MCRRKAISIAIKSEQKVLSAFRRFSSYTSPFDDGYGAGLVVDTTRKTYWSGYDNGAVTRDLPLLPLPLGFRGDQTSASDMSSS